MTAAQERPVTFDCEGDTLVGVLHAPRRQGHTGVVVVVGGPQYRVGSHRQFTLLARELANQGIAALRFDYRGMGDSDGAARSFEAVDADIRAAIDHMAAELPAVRSIYLWGLCDGASAALMYAPTDERVAGLVLLNPWVRTEQGLARAYVTHYYGNRLLSADFWKKLFTGRLAAVRSLREFAANALRARARGTGGPASATAYTERMVAAMRRFQNPVLLVLSGEDLTAAEFRAWVSQAAERRAAFTRDGIDRLEVASANHTFSSAHWRSIVATGTVDWIRRQDGASVSPPPR
jgi:exosortase A-associated hydrolase 1